MADIPLMNPSQAQAQTPDQATPTLPQTSSEHINLLAPGTQGPNSNNWRITVNEATRTIPTAHAGHSNTTGANTMPSAPQGAVSDLAGTLALSSTGRPGAATQSNPTTLHSQASGVESSTRVRVEVAETVQQGISDLERMLAGGSVPSEYQINAVRSQLREFGRHRNIFSEGLERNLNTHLSSIARRVQMGRNPTTDPTASDNVAQAAASMSDSVTPMVYLLSSPSGPQAILVSPSGLYGTIPRIISFPNESAPLTTNYQQRHRNQPHFIDRAEDFRAQRPAVHGPPNLAQPVPQDQAPARDLARILLPFGGHIWLFVRLFGFVYLFMPGGGWRRAAVFAVSALVVLFLQSGIFRPIYQAALEPFRRHVEGLVPLADNGRRDIGGGQGADAPGGDNEAQAAAGEVPDVRQVAERLLREREQRDFGVVRQYLRSFERAVAIFLASLVPGIGERHIAARDTAEAVRLIQEVGRAVAGPRREELAEEANVEVLDQRRTTTNSEPDDGNEEDRRVTHEQPPVVEI